MWLTQSDIAGVRLIEGVYLLQAGGLGLERPDSGSNHGRMAGEGLGLPSCELHQHSPFFDETIDLFFKCHMVYQLSF